MEIVHYYNMFDVDDDEQKIIRSVRFGCGGFVIQRKWKKQRKKKIKASIKPGNQKKKKMNVRTNEITNKNFANIFVQKINFHMAIH